MKMKRLIYLIIIQQKEVIKKEQKKQNINMQLLLKKIVQMVLHQLQFIIMQLLIINQNLLKL